MCEYVCMCTSVSVYVHTCACVCVCVCIVCMYVCVCSSSRQTEEMAFDKSQNNSEIIFTTYKFMFCSIFGVL